MKNALKVIMAVMAVAVAGLFMSCELLFSVAGSSYTYEMKAGSYSSKQTLSFSMGSKVTMTLTDSDGTDTYVIKFVGTYKDSKTQLKFSDFKFDSATKNGKAEELDALSAAFYAALATELNGTYDYTLEDGKLTIKFETEAVEFTKD